MSERKAWAVVISEGLIPTEVQVFLSKAEADSLAEDIEKHPDTYYNPEVRVLSTIIFEED